VTKNLHNNMHAQTQKRKEAILAKLLSVGMRRGEGGKTENEGLPLQGYYFHRGEKRGRRAEREGRKGATGGP
jgi:hypothetical protein